MQFSKDWLEVMLWQKTTSRALRHLEKVPTPSPGLDEDALWLKIARRLEERQPQPVPRSWIKLGAIAAMASLLLLAPWIWRDKTESFSYKTSNPAETLPGSSLTFAILKTDGRLHRGSSEARLHRGEGIIFYVETPGLSEGFSFTLDVLVKNPEGRIETVGDQLRIDASAKALKGELGFIVYRPEIKGIHRFYGERNRNSTIDRVNGFTVELID